MSGLPAVTAAQLLSKMLDFQKNSHAESLAKELARVDPDFLGSFGLESLLQSEGCRKAVLHILKVYIERRES